MPQFDRTQAVAMLAAAAALASPGAAHAATTVSVGPINAPDLQFHHTTGRPAQNINTESVLLPQFDEATLGKLLSVKLTLTGAMHGSLALENFGQYSSDGPVTFIGNLALEYPGGAAIVSTSPTSTQNVLVFGFDGAIDYQGTGSEIVDVWPSSDTKSTTLSLVNGNDLSAFIGAGLFAADLTARFDYNAYNKPFLASTWNSSRFGLYGNGVISIEYTYDEASLEPPPAPVPEPANWALLIVGFGLSGAAVRRRRRAGARLG